ncbi:MAG: septum formation initiator family protein [Desulfuromonadales bacterium]|nr:septum formation initiator family protein [Desulfuromonadales bacterium]
MSDKTTQSNASPARRIPWWPFGVVAVVFVFALFGDRGIFHIFKLKSQQSDLQLQLAKIEEVNAGLRKEIASLSTDRRHLERMARSQLGMVRDDEVVYQFASKKHTVPPSLPAASAEASR